MITMSRTTTTRQVGRTVVYVDSHGDPWKFVRDGVPVDCVCDPDSGLKCEYHSRSMNLRGTPAVKGESQC